MIWSRSIFDDNWKISKNLFEMNFRSFEIKIESSYFRLRQAWIFRVEFRVEFGSSFDWP